jgi:hypothetical protein
MIPRPSRRALASWDHLREQFGKGSNDADYLDPLGPDERVRSLVVSSQVLKPRTLYYFAKTGPPYALITHWKGALPSNATILVRPGVQPLHYAAAVRREAERCRCRVRFVGDLDPQDLAVFLSLAFGDYTMRPHPRGAVPITHVGINDAWLIAAEKAFPTGYGGSALEFIEWASIPLTKDEQRYLAVVEGLCRPLEQWVGPRCASLLRSGRKLELEAFLNRPPNPVPYKRALARLLGGDRRRMTRSKR